MPGTMRHIWLSGRNTEEADTAPDWETVKHANSVLLKEHKLSAALAKQDVHNAATGQAAKLVITQLANCCAVAQ